MQTAAGRMPFAMVTRRDFGVSTRPYQRICNPLPFVRRIANPPIRQMPLDGCGVAVLQKAANRVAKCRLLPSRLPPFAAPFAAYWKVAGSQSCRRWCPGGLETKARAVLFFAFLLLIL